MRLFELKPLGSPTSRAINSCYSWSSPNVASCAVMWNQVSKIFWPVLVTPKNAPVKNAVELQSRSQKLLTEMGLVKPATNGSFQILPLAQRSLDKCIRLVERNMSAVGGQKISLPILTPSALWKKSGRLDGDVTEFYMVRDRHDKEFLLSPTHEEAVTAMLASTSPISYRQLPLRLYQIGPKFRDELKARFGLMRAKEFVMKDMYTFDTSLEAAQDTYAALSAVYVNFFRQLQVPFEVVEASTGMMGGSKSHEYHFISQTGEDRLCRCPKCNYAANVEVSGEISTCPRCSNQNSSLEEVRGIEVGHTFLLGDRYTKSLGATFLTDKGKPEPLIMGCYGIGISRILAAALEVLSTDTELTWPKLLAPYDICIIGPKQGSREQADGDAVEQQVLQSVCEICGGNEVLQDDRKDMTIGKRLRDAKRIGYPMIVVIGGKASGDVPQVEFHNASHGMRVDVEVPELLAMVTQYRNDKMALLDNGGAGIGTPANQKLEHLQ